MPDWLSALIGEVEIDLPSLVLILPSTLSSTSRGLLLVLFCGILYCIFLYLFKRIQMLVDHSYVPEGGKTSFIGPEDKNHPLPCCHTCLNGFFLH